MEPLFLGRSNLWFQAWSGDPYKAGPPVPVTVWQPVPRDLGDQRVPGQEEEVSR